MLHFIIQGTPTSRSSRPEAPLSTTAQATLAEVITQSSPTFKTTESDEYDEASISSTASSSEVTASETPDSSVGEEIDNEDVSPINHPPFVIKRINKVQATSGRAFSKVLEGPIFNDDLDGHDLKLELLDKYGQSLSSESWIRFNASNQTLYGLPLEKDVSEHLFKLRATDKSGEYVDEDVHVIVQQHKSFRNVNHEIYIQVTLEKNYESTVDWETRLVQGIAEAVDDQSLASIVVRDGE